jgi:signal transduction histidine kinase
MRTLKTEKYILVVILLATAFSTLSLAENTEKVYKIGRLVRENDTEELHQRFIFEAMYLTEHISGASFEIVPVKQSEINYAVENKLIDFLFVHPLKYVELEALYGVERLVTAEVTRGGRRSSNISVAVFVKAERDDIGELEDLKGKSLIVSKQLSTDVWYILLREFKWAGIDPDKDLAELKLAYGLKNTIDIDILHAVRDGLADAGAIWAGYIELWQLRGILEDFNDYRVIRLAKELDTDIYENHSTRFYPRRTFAKLAHVPGDIAKKVTICLMSADRISNQKWKALSGWTVPADYREVHEMAKELRLPPYTDHGVIRFADVLKKYHRWIIAFSIIVVLMCFAIVLIVGLNRRLFWADKDLKAEIAERENIEHKLRESHESLEVRVQQRTSELNRQHSLLRRLTSKLSHSEEQMRRELAADIHDNISQGLAISKMKLGSLSEFSSSQKFAEIIGETSGLLSSAIEVTRTMTFELSPPVLYELGLIAALKWLAMQTSRQYDLCVQFKDNNLQLHIDDDVGTLIFRSAQELLINVAKHAKAQKVIISAEKIKGMLQVTIADDGIGFDSEVCHENGFGLFNIRERLDYIGGELEIKSEPGIGTEVSLKLPVNEEKDT